MTWFVSEMMIEMIPVESSFIRAIGYDGSTLWIEFRSGVTREYHQVPGAVYGGLMADTSKGGFFNRYVRGRYR